MSLRIILKEGISGLQRTIPSTLGSILTITISLLFLGLFFIITIGANRLVKEISGHFEIEAFLEEPINQKSLSEIQLKICAIEGVDSIKYISKEDAAKIFMEEFGEDINKILEFNPLPPSIKIFLSESHRTTEKADAISKKVEKIKGVEKILYRRELLSLFEKHLGMLNKIGLGLGVFLAISAILLVFNSTRLTIYAKRKTIQTMKLVGATRWFIRAPFLVEGAVQGLIGGIFAAVLVYSITTFVTGLISVELTEFINVDYIFYGIIIIAGIFLGLLGSIISVHRFISEKL